MGPAFTAVPASYRRVHRAHVDREHHTRQAHPHRCAETQLLKLRGIPHDRRVQIQLLWLVRSAVPVGGEGSQARGLGSVDEA